jgi:hypothetical protein
MKRVRYSFAIGCIFWVTRRVLRLLKYGNFGYRLKVKGYRLQVAGYRLQVAVGPL